MIINQIGGGGESTGAEWYVVSVPIPSMTGTLVGDSNQELSMYDAMFTSNFDITYPFEIAGQSFNDWVSFADAATQYYLSTDATTSGYSNFSSVLTVCRGVGNFKVFKGVLGGSLDMGTTTTTIPAFNMIVAAKFT